MIEPNKRRREPSLIVLLRIQYRRLRKTPTIALSEPNAGRVECPRARHAAELYAARRTFRWYRSDCRRGHTGPGSSSDTARIGVLITDHMSETLGLTIAPTSSIRARS